MDIKELHCKRETCNATQTLINYMHLIFLLKIPFWQIPMLSNIFFVIKILR